MADAFAAVPREKFVPPLPLERVYSMDEAIPTHFDEQGVSISSSSAPRIMAVMLEMLSVREGQRVLEIGAGTGYNAALLAHLVGPSGSVTSIDLNPVVAQEATANLASAGVDGVRGARDVGVVSVVTGDGWRGCPGEVFDRIMATAECWDIAPAWTEQLPDGGILVLPLWLRPALTLAVAFEKTGGTLVSRCLAYCGFMPLQGPHGGPPRRVLVPSVPWDDQIGDRAGLAGGATRPGWLSYFDDATDARAEVFRSLLDMPRSIRPAPAIFPGWNLRLTLEHPDPICVLTPFPPLRIAVGLFDAGLPSLALVEGGSMHCFGDPACGERLFDLLSAPRPLDLGDLVVTAVPPGSAEPGSGSTLIRRPSFDIVVQERSA